MGQSCYTYCKLNKGKSTAKLGTQTDLNTKEKTYYKVSSTGTTDISKAKFNSSLKKLVGSKKKTTATFFFNVLNKSPSENVTGHSEGDLFIIIAKTIPIHFSVSILFSCKK